MLHKRVTPTERVYEKVVEPSLGSFQAIPHTSHCCVRYQPSLMSSSKAPSFISTHAATLPLDTTLPKIQLGGRVTRSAVEFHQAPRQMYQSTKPDASNLQRSATPNSFNSTTQVKQVPLPQVKNNELRRSNSPRGVKNVSLSGDRYLGTFKTGQQQNSSPLHKSYPQHEAPSLPKREQVQRFEEEQSNLHVTRTMKRTSEILSHRVDRMYYLCGSGVSTQGRYDVNDSELQRLRDFSRVRNNSRANSGRSSGRSRKSMTESSVLTEIRYKRSPLGSPLGSPRSTPIPRDRTVDLSIEGSGVIQVGEEVKGHAGSNQNKMEDGRTSQMSSGSKDVNKVDGVEKNTADKEELCNCSTKSSSDKQKTSPHRTGEEEGEEKDDNERENDDNEKDNDDRQNRISGGSRNEAGQDGDPQVKRRTPVPTDGDGMNKGYRDGGVDGDSEADASRGGRVGAAGDISPGDTLKDVDGCHGDGDEAEQGSKGGGGGGGSDAEGAEGDDAGGGGGDASRDASSGSAVQDVDGGKAERGSRGGGGDAGGGGNAPRVTSSGDAVQDADGCHGDGGKDAEGKDDDDDSVTSKHQSGGGRLVESIAPGLNLDKTPFAMRKSDVYLTEFADPKREELYDAVSSSDGLRADGTRLHKHDSQIASMERKLQKVNALTQEADDIGHMAGSEDDLLEFKTDTKELGEQNYDGGVFGRARSEEERRKAIQLKEERKKAKSTLLAEQNEAQKVRDEAEKERAVKQSNKIKFRMDDVYNFISSRQREIFTQKFRELDADGNGKITLKELKKKMHKEVPKEDIHQLHKVFDLNKDKTIDQHEFVTIAALNDKLIGTEVSSEAAPLELNLNRLSLHITAYKEMFDVVDQNGDGRLAMDEIMLIIAVTTGINISIDKEAVRYIHKTIDKDGNGSIDFVEFLGFIPFFQKIYQQIVGKPVTIAEIEKARVAVRKAMRR